MCRSSRPGSSGRTASPGRRQTSSNPRQPRYGTSSPASTTTANSKRTVSSSAAQDTGSSRRSEPRSRRRRGAQGGNDPRDHRHREGRRRRNHGRQPVGAQRACVRGANWSEWGSEASPQSPGLSPSGFRRFPRAHPPSRAESSPLLPGVHVVDLEGGREGGGLAGSSRSPPRRADLSNDRPRRPTT